MSVCKNIVKRARCIVKSREILFRYVMGDRSLENPDFLAIVVTENRVLLSQEERSNLGRKCKLSYFTYEEGYCNIDGEPYRENSSEWFGALDEAYKALLVRKTGDGFTKSSDLTMNAMKEAVINEIIDLVGDIDGDILYGEFDNNVVTISVAQSELIASYFFEPEEVLEELNVKDIVEHRRSMAT